MHSLAHVLASGQAHARPPDPSDWDAINAVNGGHREMFEIIVRRYNAQLYRAGMAYLRNHAQTEDAMQNAYLKAFLHLARFRGGSSFATWLTRIMINECLMIIRSGKRAVMENIDDENFRRPERLFEDGYDGLAQIQLGVPARYEHRDRLVSGPAHERTD